MDLLAALRMQDLPAPPRLALVGAGGKSTALFLIARQLLAQYPTVLVSATTHLASDQARLADQHLVVERAQDLDALELLPGVRLITGAPDRDLDDPGCRLAGLNSSLLKRVLDMSDVNQLPLLVEADGARRLPFKAPAEHEPAVPGFVDRVIVVAGLSGLGRPLDYTSVHRPERFAELSGMAFGEPVTGPALARVLAHPQGGLKNIPPHAQRILLLNHAEVPARRQAAESLVEDLLACYSAVLIAALEQPGAPVLAAYEPAAGIILAAGEGRRFAGRRFAGRRLAGGRNNENQGDSRFGQSKLLLEWDGETLVHRAARLAIQAGLQTVRVVLGAHAPKLEEALQGLKVEIILNPDWAEGQSTSVKAGLAGLPDATGAAMFLLADQPFVSRELLLALRRQHALSLAPLVAPWCGGRRANPALFDRCTFPDLFSLTGDTGGRVLFDMPGRYVPAWLPWPDERLLLDIDSPEDFQRLKEMSEP